MGMSPDEMRSVSIDDYSNGDRIEGALWAVCAEICERLLDGQRLSCRWTETEECYQTQCGNSFIVNNDSLSENGMKFCCFCGGEIKEGK